MAQAFTTRHVVFVGLVGVLCVGFLGALAVVDARYLVLPIVHDPGAYLTFAALAILARFVGFPLAAAGSFALDTPIYTAAMLCIGAGPAALVAFVAMALRGALDWVLRVRAGVRWPLPTAFAKWLFAPALTGAVIASLGLAFDLRPLTHYEAAGVVTEVAVFGVMALGILVLQFAAVLVSYRLDDVPWTTIRHGIAGPALLGEATFLPLGFALAIAYRDQHVPTLAALAASYLIFNYVFRRMGSAIRMGRETAQELALAEVVGRTVASTLDVEEVGRRVGVALLDTIPEARGVVLTVLEGPEGFGHSHVRAVDRADKPAILEAVLQDLEREFARTGRKARRAPDASPVAPADGIVCRQPLTAPDGTTVVGYLSFVYAPGVHPTDRGRRVLVSLARQTAVAVENWRLYNLATEDGLTGLYVRRYVESRVREEFERAVRGGHRFCVMMIDVDDLKRVNDRFGHAAGDRLLRTVGDALRATVRGMDVAGRWGGDEFAVLLPDLDPAQGLEVAHRLLDEIRRRAFPVGDRVVTPSVSIGIAAYPDCRPADAARMVELADAALYAVKNSGSKGFVVTASPAEPAGPGS
jgi:diguanylate cyclase (GGDEF)-like protein